MPKEPSLLEQLRRVLSAKDVFRIGREVASETVSPGRAATRLGVEPAFRRTEEMLQHPSVDSLMALSGGAKPGVFYPQTAYAGEVLSAVQRAANAQKYQDWRGNPDENLRRAMVRQQVGEAARLLSEATKGFYNPLTNRVSFPASIPSGSERSAAIPVAASKFAQQIEGGPENIFANRQQRVSDETRKLRESGMLGRSWSQEQYEQSPLAGARAAYGLSKSPAAATQSYFDAFQTAYNFLTESARNPRASERDLVALDRVFPDATRIARVMLQQPLFARHPLAKKR
jgi:hypothetical protein